MHWRIAADRATAGAGERLVYTVTATNAGTAPFIGATVIDDLTDVLAHATFNGDATGGATFDPATGLLTWRADVPAGAAVTMTYSVTAGEVATETDIVNRLRSGRPRQQLPGPPPTLTARSAPRSCPQRPALAVARGPAVDSRLWQWPRIRTRLWQWPRIRLRLRR